VSVTSAEIGLAPNPRTQPTRLSRVEIQGVFGSVGNLPARLLLPTRLAAQR
jgi:hypothetical protein